MSIIVEKHYIQLPHTPNIQYLQQIDINILQANTSSSNYRIGLGFIYTLLRAPEEEVPEEEPEEEKDETQQKLEEIEKKFRGLVSLGRSLGLTMAADNLEWYLDGNGGVKEMDSDWLRGFIETRHAIEVNQGRFEESFYERAKQLEDGETLVFREQWDNMYWGIQPKLYLAVGTSTIESHGDFTLVRNGNTVTIEGNVRNNWWDVYDWDPQKSSYYGVSQDDANFLQEHGGAKNFDMKSEWNQIIYGEIEFRWWWIDRQDYWWY